MRKFNVLMGIAACAFAGAAVAAPGISGADAANAVQAALDQHDLTAAGIALNNVVEARLPAKEPAKPDPVLDRLFADMLSANNELLQAGAILHRVVDDATTPNMDHYRLLLATYEEATGAWAEALRGYRQIAASANASPETALSATFGIARLQMADDPSAALATLAAVDSDRVPHNMAWEFDLLTGTAASLAGPDKLDAATAAFDRAWAEVPFASVADGAAARVAAIRALAAGRAGDRKSMVAMLAVDRSGRDANAGQQWMVNDLPICGTEGITPQDYVLVSVARQPPAGRPPITLAWASRPGIAAPFLLTAARSGSLSVPDGQVATFGLRCRTTPSVDYVVRNSVAEDIAGWMTGRGAYPSAGGVDGDGISSLATRLAQREARYGANSVMLLPLLFRTIDPSEISFADPENRKQASTNADRILAILQQNNAPGSLTRMWRLTSIGIAVVAQKKTEAQGQEELQAVLGEVADDPTVSLDTLYALVTNTARMPNVPSDFKMAMLDASLDILNRKAPAGDQRTAAVALRLYQLRKSTGDDDGAKDAIARLNMPKDACDLSDPMPHYVSSNIASQDYPGDLVLMGMLGLSYAEFDLDAGGDARNGRLLLEDPPFAFNQIALERIPTIRYDPARFDGSVAACRAVTQSIRWQLPYAGY